MPYQAGATVGTLVNADTIFGLEPKTRYQKGERVDTLGGVATEVGFARSFWFFSWLSISDWTNTKSILASGELSGTCVIQTRNDEDVFSNYNAIVKFPEPQELERQNERYLDVELEFILTSLA